MIQTEERTERDALNEKPESRNLFICDEVCLSSIRRSDERTGLTLENLFIHDTG
jgi:hypothetical protein